MKDTREKMTREREGNNEDKRRENSKGVRKRRRIKKMKDHKEKTRSIRRKNV